MGKGYRKAVAVKQRGPDPDLMEMKSLYDRLVEKYREVLELQSLKDSLVQMVVHDFKNHLTGATGYLELLDDELKACPGEDRHAYLTKARYHVERIRCMAADLLDLNRLEENKLPLHKENMPLRAMVEEALGELLPRMEEKGISAAIEDTAPGASVEVDRRLFIRVVGNILSNGVRYSPAGGEIRLSLGGLPDGFSLSIGNEGPRIPEAALDRIFEKFYQVEASSEGYSSGTGLGLAFCDMAIKAHGGWVEARNNPDKGCTFTIHLPYPPGGRL